MIPITNDVHARLLASFRNDRADIVPPLLAMGWNATTTITIARHATVFDEPETTHVTMWKLACEAHASTVIAAWLEAAHPFDQDLIIALDQEAVQAWHHGHYAMAATLTQHLQRSDPIGHAQRLTKVSHALSDPEQRSMKSLHHVEPVARGDGVMKWFECGGHLDALLQPINNVKWVKNPRDLNVASPLMRWLITSDVSALEAAAAHDLNWSIYPCVDVVYAFAHWSAAAVERDRSRHPMVQEQFLQWEQWMLEGRYVLERLFREHPCPHVWRHEVQTLLPIVVNDCVKGHAWEGKAEGWAKSLLQAFEERFLNEDLPPTLLPPVGRSRL